MSTSMSSSHNFETEIKLGWVHDGGEIQFYHPKKKKCFIVTGKLIKRRKRLWFVSRFPRREDRWVGDGCGVQFVAASSALAAARKFYRQFHVGWFK